MRKSVLLVAMILTVALISSCETGHKDCQGHRHHVKTEMGGYL